MRDSQATEQRRRLQSPGSDLKSEVIGADDGARSSGMWLIHGTRCGQIVKSGGRKTLVMREVPEDQVEALLSRNDSLAACDVAVFVHDCSVEISWMKTTELLMEVASHGARNGFDMPCLVVSAKNDLGPCSLALEDLTRVSRDAGVETPIPVSVKLKDYHNLFCRIIIAAQHPHLSIPETEAWSSCKLECRLVNHSLVPVSVGAAAVVIALVACSVYASRNGFLA